MGADASIPLLKMKMTSVQDKVRLTHRKERGTERSKSGSGVEDVENKRGEETALQGSCNLLSWV